MRNKWLIVSVSLALILGLLLGPGCAKPAPAVEPIVVGSLMDATGPINIYGLPNIDAMHLAIDKINAEGGLLGRPLKLIEYDTQSTNELYVKYATELCVKHKAVVIMGGITSASREVVRPITRRYKVPFIYTSVYEGGVADRYHFCLGSVPEQEIEPLVKYMTEKYGPRVYRVAADYIYGWVACDWAEVFAEKYGGEPVGKEFIPLEIAEFSTTLAKIQAAKPDWIYSSLVGGNHIAFYRQWAAMGLKDQFPIASPSFGNGMDEVILSPEEGEGIYTAHSYFAGLDTPENKEFTALVHERYGKDYPLIGNYFNISWNSWLLWAEAVKLAGTTEAEAVIAALESGLEFDAPQGKIKLDPGTHHCYLPIYLAKVNNRQGYDIIKDYGLVAPTWHQETFDLIKNPELNKQFTPWVYK